jgi:hypothetical protein
MTITPIYQSIQEYYMSQLNDLIGQLASEIGYELPVIVLKSQAGYYLGTQCPINGPISRESTRYWSTHKDAVIALFEDAWEQRTHA